MHGIQVVMKKITHFPTPSPVPRSLAGPRFGRSAADRTHGIFRPRMTFLLNIRHALSGCLCVQTGRRPKQSRYPTRAWVGFLAHGPSCPTRLFRLLTPRRSQSNASEQTSSVQEQPCQPALCRATTWWPVQAYALLLLPLPRHLALTS